MRLDRNLSETLVPRSEPLALPSPDGEGIGATNLYFETSLGLWPEVAQSPSRACLDKIKKSHSLLSGGTPASAGGRRP